ncbi:hypothetical protein WMY93_018154 [Mugilogobius chulae]|uniref:Protein kinase domain-containing protein n=1 Tax=Mugilogobius chulae TaxID=88201 RepID=A0AAW0NI11_9GOBI
MSEREGHSSVDGFAEPPAPPTKSASRHSLPRCRNSFTSTEEHPHIGNYRLLKTIGKGNFAKVKLARHVLTGRESDHPCPPPRPPPVLPCPPPCPPVLYIILGCALQSSVQHQKVRLYFVWRCWLIRMQRHEPSEQPKEQVERTQPDKRPSGIPKHQSTFRPTPKSKRQCAPILTLSRFFHITLLPYDLSVRSPSSLASTLNPISSSHSAHMTLRATIERYGRTESADSGKVLRYVNATARMQSKDTFQDN